MTTANTPSGTGLDQAVSFFSELLDPETRTTKPSREASEKVEAEAHMAEALEDETPDETPDHSEADEAEDDADAEDDSEADEDDNAEELIDLDKLVTVKIGDKTEKIKVSELQKGYQRQADYTRKAQALAEERKSFTEDADKVRYERAEYAKIISAHEESLVRNGPRKPDPSLQQTDPIGYLTAVEAYRAADEEYRAVQAEKDRLSETQKRESNEALKAVKSEEFEKLYTIKPEWKDPKVFAKAGRDMVEAGKKAGFSEQELNSTLDHRLLLVLDRLAQMDKVSQSKPVPVQNGPKRMPTGTANTAPKRQTQLSRAQERLSAEGSLDAAKDFFGAYLKK